MKQVITASSIVRVLSMNSYPSPIKQSETNVCLFTKRGLSALCKWFDSELSPKKRGQPQEIDFNSKGFYHKVSVAVYTKKSSKMKPAQGHAPFFDMAILMEFYWVKHGLVECRWRKLSKNIYYGGGEFSSKFPTPESLIKSLHKVIDPVEDPEADRYSINIPSVNDLDRSFKIK